MSSIIKIFHYFANISEYGKSKKSFKEIIRKRMQYMTPQVWELKLMKENIFFYVLSMDKWN